MHIKGNYKHGEKTTLRMGEIIANETIDKGLSINQSINFQNIQAAHTIQYLKITQPNQNVGERHKQTFLHRDIQMAKKHMKRCSTSLIITEMQIKNTMRYWLIPVRVATIKKFTNNKCWKGHGERGTFLNCWWK